MAADKEFLIPLGADLTPLLSALREGRTNVKALEDQSKQSSKNMQDAFSQVIRSQKEIVAESVSGSRAIKDEAQQAILLGNVFKQLADSSSKATDTNKLKKYADEFKKLADFAQKGLRVNVSDEELTLLTTLLNATKNEMEELAAVVTILKGKLDTMDPRSEEWDQLNQAIQLSEKVIQDFGQAEDGVEKKTVSLRTQLRTMKQELALMEDQGLENTKGFQDLQIAAGKLEDQLGDTAARVRILASDTKYIDAAIQAAQGLAAGFGLAQGAAALFGSENEELAKALNKVQGVMVILQSLQTIQQLLQKQSALAVVAETAAKTANVGVTGLLTGAVRTLNAAIAANPLGVLLVALGVVIAAVQAFRNDTEDAAAAQEKLNDATKKFADDSLKYQLALLDRTTPLILAQAKARGASERELQLLERNGIQERIRSYEEALTKVKGIKDKELELEENILDEKAKLTLFDLNNKIKANEKKTDADKKYRDDQIKKEEAYQQALESLRKKYTDLTLSAIVSERERSKKEAAVRANEQIADINKLLAEQKKAGKLTEELETSASKVKSQIRQQYVAEVLKIDLDFYKQQEDLLKAANDAINDINKSESQKQIDDINARYDAIIENLNNSNKKLGEQSSLSAEDIAIIEKNNNAIFDLNKAREKDIIRTKQAYALAKLDIEEKLAIDTIELQKFSGLTEEQIAKLKEEQKIAVTKLYGQKRLDLIKQQLVSEKKLTAEQFDQIINQNNINSAANSGKDIFDYLGLSDTLSEETKNKISKAILEATTNVQIEAKKKLDLSSSSGLGSSLLVQLFGATNEQADLAIGTFNRIFNAYQQMIDMQITAKDRQLGILRDQINEVENELNRELDAQKNGYASNVAAKQLELDQLKAQRDKELADQKELVKQKAQLAAASAATDSIVQAAQLGSAAAIAFKKGQESSFNPILGVILALAAIATMVTGFITIKAQMKAAAAPQFDEGGGLVLEGPDHSQGGLDVVEKRTGKTKGKGRGGE